MTALSHQLVEDPIQIARLLHQGGAKGATAKIQFEGTEKTIRARLRERPRGVPLIETSAPASFDPKAIDSRRAKIMVFLETQILAFETELKETLAKSLRFEFPSKLFKIQRRNAVRLTILAGYDLNVELISPESKRPIKRRLLDLSTSGLSFQVLSSRELGYWKKGLMLKDIVLPLEGRQIQVSGQIVSQVDLPDDARFRGTKVGIKFIRLKPEDEEYIHLYISEKLAHLVF